MVADNCRLSCQLDTLVLLTNRSAKLIRKCCKSGNYGYHFSLAAIQMNRIRKRFRIFAGTKLKDKNVKYNFFQTIKDGNPQSGLPISLIFKERNYAYFTEYFIHTPQQRFTV